jgi:hypothetical protein
LLLWVLMRARSLAVVTLLAVAIALPSAADAAKPRAQVKPRGGAGAQRPQRRVQVKPLRGSRGGPSSLGQGRGVAPQAASRRAPAIQLGHTPGRRTHYRPDGRMAPTAPGYGDFRPFVGGHEGGPMSKVGKVVVTTIAVGVIGVAALAIGIPLLHNLPQLLNLR